jgi:archaellum component FlaC
MTDNIYLDKNIEELKNKINSLENLIIERFDKLEKMFNDLENNKLKDVQESCNRMNSHINFINETYATLETPLNYVKNKLMKQLNLHENVKDRKEIKRIIYSNDTYASKLSKITMIIQQIIIQFKDNIEWLYL